MNLYKQMSSLTAYNNFETYLYIGDNWQYFKRNHFVEFYLKNKPQQNCGCKFNVPF